MTRTVIPMEKARLKSREAMDQMIKVTRAIAITTGTKIAATLSAIPATGALVPLASSTSWTIRARVLLLPTLSAVTRRKPCWLTVPPVTRSPASLSTGKLSPVRADSSTADVPLKMTPSMGMPLPGLTCTISPGRTWDVGISTTAYSRSTKATAGARSISCRTASPVFALLRASRNLPTVIRVRIVADDSK